MTQEDFSELLDISVAFLSLVELGKSSPSFKKLEVFARRLQVPVAFLFDFRNVSGPKKVRSGRSRTISK